MVKSKERIVVITQTRSAIRRVAAQKDTLKALGIRRVGGSVRKRLSPPVAGMIARVAHLVSVSETEV